MIYELENGGWGAKGEGGFELLVLTLWKNFDKLSYLEV
jgi:hypothetical protein